MKMWRENQMGQVNRGSENQWTARERERARAKDKWENVETEPALRYGGR